LKERDKVRTEPFVAGVLYNSTGEVADFGCCCVFDVWTE